MSNFYLEFIQFTDTNIVSPPGYNSRYCFNFPNKIYINLKQTLGFSKLYYFRLFPYYQQTFSFSTSVITQTMLLAISYSVSNDTTFRCTN